MVIGQRDSAFGGGQQVIGRYIVKTAERDEMVEGHFIGTPLVPGIHGLRGAEDLGGLRYRLLLV